MNAYEVISACLEFYDYVATSSDNSTIRAKVLARQNEVFAEAWCEFGDGADFTQAQTTVTLAASASSATLPTDFMSFGEQGVAVLRRSSGAPKEIRCYPAADVIKQLEYNGSTTHEPSCFYISQWSGSDFVPKLIFDTLADQSYTIALSYTKKPPALTDANSSSSGLQTFPEEYHRSVIYKGTLARFAKDTGNRAQAKELEAEYQVALAKAKSNRSLTAIDNERIGVRGHRRFRRSY